MQEEGSETNVAFSKLTGTDYRDSDGVLHYPEARDLSEHALAYYQFILGFEEDTLRGFWRDSREYVGNLLAEHGIEIMEDLPRQGLQTVHFGMTLLERFVEKMQEEADVSVDVLPGDDAVDEAILFAASELGGDDSGRKNHLDDFVELLARAAQAEYLERGTHYEVVNEGSPEQEMAFHLATCHDAVSKYVRDHDIDSVDLLNSASDYRDHMKEHADKNDSYVITHSQVTAGLNRCARIDPTHAADVLDFNLNAFEFDLAAPTPSPAESDSSSSDAEVAADGGDTLFAKVTNAITQLGNANASGAKPGRILDRLEDDVESVEEVDAVLMKGLRKGKFEMHDDGGFSVVSEER